MLLHRIDDPASALTREPHKGYLQKATPFAPAGTTFSTFAGRVLHGELLAYSVARAVADPEGLLLLEMDPDGAAVNIASLTLRPGSHIFGEMLAELWAWTKVLGFYRLECRSRRFGMARLLKRHNWREDEGEEDAFFRFSYHGPEACGIQNPRPEPPEPPARCPESGTVYWLTNHNSGRVLGACPGCGVDIEWERSPANNDGHTFSIPEHWTGAPSTEARIPFGEAYAVVEKLIHSAPTMADLPEDFPYFMGDAR